MIVVVIPIMPVMPMYVISIVSHKQKGGIPGASSLAGTVSVGGGAGDTGVTITDAGVLSVDGATTLKGTASVTGATYHPPIWIYTGIPNWIYARIPNWIYTDCSGTPNWIYPYPYPVGVIPLDDDILLNHPTAGPYPI
jgi:hypothetical protein